MNQIHAGLILKKMVADSQRSLKGPVLPVYLRTSNNVAPTVTDSGVRAPTDTLLVPQPEVDWLSEEEVHDAAGTYFQGDMVFIISSSAVTLTQLEAAIGIKYGTEVYRIRNHREMLDLFGQAEAFRIVAGREYAS